MRVRFDQEVGAIYVRLDETKKVVESEEVKPGVILDFDEDDQVVGIEILHVKERVPLTELKKIQFEVA